MNCTAPRCEFLQILYLFIYLFLCRNQHKQYKNYTKSKYKGRQNTDNQMSITKKKDGIKKLRKKNLRKNINSSMETVLHTSYTIHIIHRSQHLAIIMVHAFSPSTCRVQVDWYVTLLVSLYGQIILNRLYRKYFGIISKLIIVCLIYQCAIVFAHLCVTCVTKGQTRTHI